ncbi:MAG TPA: iron chelate uptake ABC transporter family permease subunit, partial [Candidatus Deferrimicrobium sp.]|nr:iron chelate uptake ABC transporter family permease subunit [Candidatus Deferrimicrobium sp.]
MGLKRNIWLWTGGLGSLLLVSALISITLGSVHLPLSQTIKILLSPMVDWVDKPWGIAQETIVWQLRMPRIFLALVVGAMLASSGVAFQGILRNPLADPYILGVSSGAALGAAISILFVQKYVGLQHFTLPLFAFLGAVLSLGAVLLLAHNQGRTGGDSLILAGVVIQSLVGAILSFLIAMSG